MSSLVSIRSHTGFCGLPSLTLNYLSAFHMITVQDCEVIPIFIIQFIITLIAVFNTVKIWKCSKCPLKRFLFFVRYQVKLCTPDTQHQTTNSCVSRKHISASFQPCFQVLINASMCKKKSLNQVCSLYKVIASLQQTWIKLLDSWIVFLYNVVVTFLKPENIGCLDFQKMDGHDYIRTRDCECGIGFI